MTPVSSSNRSGRLDDATLISTVSTTRAASGAVTTTGVVRLPIESPAAFIQHFNRVYESIGMRTASGAGVMTPSNVPSSAASPEFQMQNSDWVEGLLKSTCAPCHGGTAKIERDVAARYLNALPGWSLDRAGEKILRQFKATDFSQAMAVLRAIADLADRQQHHPDLHLTHYRDVRIDLTTHAIGGLSQNDFILAAKIDRLLDRLG